MMASQSIARNIEKVLFAGSDGARRALPTIGVEVVNTVRRLVTNPSPSAPGDPPGLVTGGLRLSYTWELGTERGRPFVAVGSDANVRQPTTGKRVTYAAFLELGTRNMAPRPHLRPAFNIVRQRIPDRVARFIAEAERRREFL